jgi:hypothetical protein
MTPCACSEATSRGVHAILWDGTKHPTGPLMTLGKMRALGVGRREGISWAPSTASPCCQPTIHSKSTCGSLIDSIAYGRVRRAGLRLVRSNGSGDVFVVAQNTRFP